MDGNRPPLSLSLLGQLGLGVDKRPGLFSAVMLCFGGIVAQEYRASSIVTGKKFQVVKRLGEGGVGKEKDILSYVE